MITRVLATAAMIAAVACGGSEAKPAGNDDALTVAWRASKLEVSALSAVDGTAYGSKACRGGTVSSVDVVLCDYGSGEDAQAATELGLVVVGTATGSALARGTRLLVVVDRRKADPSGRTIDAITTAFRK